MRPNQYISARCDSRSSRSVCVRRSAHEGGFTLIELMVGILLGMVTVAIIAQVFAVSESQKRSTTTGADAQVNGALAMYALQRETQMAGFGFADYPSGLGCVVKYQYSTNAASTFALVPVVITSGSNGSNVVTLLRSGKNSFSFPILVASNHDQSADSYTVQSTLGVTEGDLMVVVPSTSDTAAGGVCAVVQVASSGSKTLTSSSIPVTSGGVWNQQSILPSTGYQAGAYMLDMGALSYVQYSVNVATNALQQSVMTSATGSWSAAQDLYQQIVVLKAMYGKDTNADGNVDTYDNVTPTTAAGWTQVRAVRLMLVARSNQFEKDEVTDKDLLWDVGSHDNIAGTASCNGGSKCVSVSVSFLPDWKHYRYKIYDTIAPMRNVMWNN